jgi:hypothetical protein
VAVPHYAYIKLQMTANRGPLTISGSFASFENSNKDFNSLSQTFGVHEELHHIKKSTNMDVDPLAQKNAPELSFDASKDTWEHQIHPMDPSKTAQVSNSLSPALVEFLCEHWRMFTWCPADMPGIPRELAEHELKIFPNAKPIK